MKLQYYLNHNKNTLFRYSNFCIVCLRFDTFHQIHTQSMEAIIHRFIEITINRNIPFGSEEDIGKEDIKTFFLIFCFYFLGPIYTNRLLLGIGIIIQIMWTCYIAFGFCVLDDWNKDGVMLYYKLYGWVLRCVFFYVYIRHLFMEEKSDNVFLFRSIVVWRMLYNFLYVNVLIFV